MSISTLLWPALLVIGINLTVSLAANAASSAPLGVPDSENIPWYNDSKPSDDLLYLGKVLFFDNRLVPNENQSCASCHDPNMGFSDGVALDIKHNGVKDKRNSPHLYNLAWAPIVHWDGRTKEKCYIPEATKEEVCLPPLEGQAFKSMKKRGVYESFIPKLRANATYRKLFKKAFPPDGAITHANMAIAIGAFERTLVSNNSTFDRYMKGDSNALSHEAKRGMALFVGKAKCIVCHNGPNFTDYGFHNIGLDSDDRGRGEKLELKSMQGAFKTPGLRNAVLTAPYMHDGSLGTLEDVIRFYNRGGDRKENLSKDIVPLNMSDQEIWDLVAFLASLTDPVFVERPNVP